MKDIKLDNKLKDYWYIISWIIFIVLSPVFGWIIGLALYTYGKNTVENTEYSDVALTMTYQKFIYYWGMIWGSIILLIVLTIFILDKFFIA